MAVRYYDDVRPLDSYFGSKTTIRMLRVLAIRDEGCTPAVLADTCGLSSAQMQAGLAMFDCDFLVEHIGDLVRLRADHELTAPIRALFWAESLRFKFRRDEITNRMHTSITRGFVWVPPGEGDGSTAD